MKVREKLFSNTFYLFLDSILISLLSFIFWLIAGKTLNPSDYGIIVTAINFVLFVYYFAMFGIPNALTKLIPEFIARKKMKSVYSLISMSLKPIFIGLVVLNSIFLLFSIQLSALLKIPYNAFVISVISISTITIVVLLGSILYGFQNMKKYFMTDLATFVTKIFLSIFLLILGFGYFSFLIGFTMGYILTIFLRLDLKYFKSDHNQVPYKKLFEYSIPAFVSSISLAFINNSQYIILSILKNTEVTGLFAIAFIISSVVGITPGVLTSALFPIVSSMPMNKSKTKQCYLISLIFRYSLFIVAPLATLLLVFSKYAVLFFAKSDFLRSTTYFPIIIPGAILYGLANIYFNNLYAIGKPKIFRNISIFITLLFLSTSLLLVNYFSAIGLSFAYLITMLALFVLSFFYINKFIGQCVFISDTIKILVASSLMLVLTLFLREFVNSLFVLFVVSFVALIFYILILLFFKFYNKEDIFLLENISRYLPFLDKKISSVTKLIERLSAKSK